MTFDDWLGITREFSLSNYPSRKLVRVRLEWDDGKPTSIEMPDEVEEEVTGEFNSVEQAIIDVLEAAQGERVTVKKMLAEVKRVTKKSESAIYRSIRRLKAEKIIACNREGYILAHRSPSSE